MGNDFDPGRWYLEPAVAYAASTHPQWAGLDAAAMIDAAIADGVRLYRYKRKPVLARVQRVIGFLRGVGPESILDIGSGRGAALWPMMDALPETRFTCIDSSPQRAEQLAAVARGWNRLEAFEGSAENLPFADGSFDVVTALEVLEHMERPGKAASDMARVCRRFVVVSVPSKPDDNPEHLRLFSRDSMREILEGAGLRQLKFDGVPNHMIVAGQR